MVGGPVWIGIAGGAPARFAARSRRGRSPATRARAVSRGWWRSPIGCKSPVTCGMDSGDLLVRLFGTDSPPGRVWNKPNRWFGACFWVVTRKQ